MSELALGLERLKQEVEVMVRDDPVAERFLFFTYEQNARNGRFAFRRDFLDEIKPGQKSNNAGSVGRMELRIIEYKNIIDKVNARVYFMKTNPGSETAKEIRALGITKVEHGVGYYIRAGYLEAVKALYEGRAGRTGI